MANHFPFAAESVHAPVTDAEFRTYVLLCALAWKAHPEANPPYVELTYADLADRHPKPVAVPTLRVRVMTLVKLGYLRREQVNRSTWRTYVTGLAPLPPSGGGGTKVISPKLPDKVGPVIVQRNRGGEETKPSASSPQPDRPVITLDAGEGDRPVLTLDASEGDRPMITLDAHEGDRPMITLDAAPKGDRPVITLGAKPSADSRQPDRPTITLDASEGDRPVITHEPDRPVITQNTQSSDLAPHPSLSWGDMIRQSVNLTPYLNGDSSQTPEPTAPKGRLFQRDTGDPVLARGRARERHFFQVTSPKPDRPVITQEEPSADRRQPDRPAITLEPDRPMITLDAAEGDRPTITHEPDQPVITLGGTEGDHPTITLEPDHPVPTFNVTEGDRPVITLEGNLAEGDRGLITQTAEGDRPAITLAPSRAHARVRAHADQDQDQITDLTDPDLIKLDLKNKKSDQSDHTPKDLDRARWAKPEADPEFSAWARTGTVVPDADFGLSARTGMGDEALAGTDLPDSDSDFGLSARTGVGDEIPVDAEQSDSDPDFGSSSRTGGGNGRSTLDVQALSSQPSASRFPGSNDSGRHASKNPPLTAPQTANSGPSVSSRHPATNPSPKASPRQASKEPSSTPASPLTAPQATIAGPTAPTRQTAKTPSLKAAPSLDSILAGLDETHRQLAQDLLSLKPEPMDLKGVAEVMAKPVLTAAWYAWATDPANGVRKPAAYLRSMVRKGYFPPPRPGDEPDQPVSTVDADGVDRSNPNYDVWPGGFTVGKGEIFDPTTYVHPSRRNDLVWP